MRLIKTLIIAVLFLLAITFALQNQQLVTLNYYGLISPFSVPVFLIVFVSVLIGILIAGFGDIYVRYSLRIRARKCEKQLKACRQELESLKKAGEEKRAVQQAEPVASPAGKETPAEQQAPQPEKHA